jgi:hypothetical protein
MSPEEAMDALKARNPDYDHRPWPPNLPNPVNYHTELVCECGKPIWLAEINSTGMTFTHLRPAWATPASPVEETD